MSGGTTYEDAGVHNEEKEKVSDILYNAAKRTWDNRKGKLGEVITPFDDFSGVRAIDVSNLPTGTLMNIGFDGVGTKMEFAERTGNHSTVAFDLFAMVVDDAVVRGAEPILVGSVLDTNSLKSKDGTPFIKEVRQLAEGYISAAKAANVAVVNGETAELGTRIQGYGDFCYTWSAATVWIARRDRLFTGMEIKDGDYLVGLGEEGFRSNGLSLVRKIMKNIHGDNWHQKSWKRGDASLADMALIPSRIYCAALVDMFGGYCGEPKTEVHGVAHITGGGIPGKLGRVLKPSGLGAIIDSPFEPSEFMEYVQALGNVSDVEAYKTWNMRQGMIVVTPKPDSVRIIAANYGIDSKIIGRVVKEPGIRITNRGAFCPDKNPSGGMYPQGDRVLVFN